MFDKHFYFIKQALRDHVFNIDLFLEFLEINNNC